MGRERVHANTVRDPAGRRTAAPAPPTESHKYHAAPVALTAAGNLALGRTLAACGIRAKLNVSQPGDPEEQEADRVADAVVQRIAGPTIQRKCSACEEEEDVHRKGSSSATSSGPTDVDRALEVVRHGGESLPSALRSAFEPKLARDLSSVRVHTDSSAATAARNIGARAYTVGNRIAFASGEFRPHEPEGLRLLAHELTHVAQAPGSPVRRQAVPSNPDAGTKADAAKSAKAAPPIKGASDTFYIAGDNITISESKEQVVDALKHQVVRTGPKQPDTTLAWLEQYAGGLAAARAFKKDYEADPKSVSGGVPESEEELGRRERVRDKLLPVARDAVAEVNTATATVVNDFLRVMKDNALQTLAASKRRAEAERLRYGVTTTKTTQVVGYSKGGGAIKKEVTRHDIADAQSPAVKGLQAAAKLLLARRKVVRDKEAESRKHIACFMGTCGTDSEYDRINAEALKLRKDYISLHQALAFEYPLLDRIGGIEQTYALGEDAIWASNELEKLAAGQSDTEVATTVGERIADTLEKNQTATEGVQADRANLWRMKDVYELSRAQTGLDADPFKNKVVSDKWRSEQPNVIDAVVEGILLLLLNIGALVLAAPTGGVSLAVAFGVNAAMAVEHTREYLLNKGLAGSDLRRAQSLSQDDPSLVWLAVEIIGVGLDGAAAVHAFKTMRPVVDAVRVAGKDAEITADAARSIKNAAESLGKPELAEKVIEKLPKGNVAALEAAAPGAKAEIAEFAKTTGALEKEAANTFGDAVRAASGGKLNISKTGYIWSCHSPCTMLREKFAEVFAADKDLLKKLTDLETRAANASKVRAAAKDATAIADAEKELANVKQAAAEIENTADDALRTLKNPGEVAALKDIVGSTAHQAPTLISSARISQVAQQLGQKFPIIQRLSEGAIERVVRAAFAANEGGGLRKAVRGLVAARAQLLEEISATRVRALLATAEGREALGVTRAGERAIFIEGSRIRDATGAMLTDGIIAVQRGNRLEIVAVLEAKAGHFAAEGLAEAVGGLKRASTMEIVHELFEASGGRINRGPLAEIAKSDPALHQLITGTHGANTAANEALVRSSRDALMAAIDKLPDAQLMALRDAMRGGQGQVARDVERLMSDANREVQLIIDGQPVTGWSSQRPQFLGAVPKGVDTADIAAELAKEKYLFKELDFANDAATKAQLNDTAKALVNALENDMLNAAKTAPH